MHLDGAARNGDMYYYATFFGTAKGKTGGDYAYVENYESVSATAGERSFEISVQTNDDNEDENDEYFDLHVSTDSTVTDSDPSGRGTIRDNDDPAPTSTKPGISRVSNPSITEGGALVFTVHLDGAARNGDMYYYATFFGTAKGKTGGDYAYVENYESVSATAGERSFEISVQTNDDNEDENDEYFDLHVSTDSTVTDLTPLVEAQFATMMTQSKPPSRALAA